MEYLSAHKVKITGKFTIQTIINNMGNVGEDVKFIAQRII